MVTATAIVAILVVLTQVVMIFGFVLLDRRQPVATLAWLFAILFMPIVGVVLYLVFGMPRFVRRSRRALTVVGRVEEALLEHCIHDRGDDADPARCDERTAALIRLGSNLSLSEASANNGCQILVNAAATYRAMIDAILAATDHVHVQFYIIQPDRTGLALRDILVAKAQQGLDVRVLVDGVGSRSLPSGFWYPLVEAGGEATVFSPVTFFARLRRRDRIDFRNHRKIVVVDGEIGFTGGINVGTEYLGLNPHLGHWRDTHMRIDGPAVLSLQKVFVEDWLAATDKLLDEPRYFPDVQPAGACVVQVIESGPDRSWSSIHHLYFSMITLARKRVWITSPYFVPDAVIEEALICAALRGVDVRLLLPSRSDSVLVSVASRSYYARLLEAGVQIDEYARGFVHAKTLVVDEWAASIGSANMDIRSFHLNYEINVFVFNQEFTSELSDVFLDDLKDAESVTLESQTGLSYMRRLARACARLLSPLL